MLVERCKQSVSVVNLHTGRTLSFRARFDAFVPFSSPFFFFSFSDSAPFFSSTLPPFDFARSFRSAISSIRTCRSSCSFKRFACLPSPSCLAILAFISARSMSQAFRARSWLCHSICRKRMTPVHIDKSAYYPPRLDAPSSWPISPESNVESLPCSVYSVPCGPWCSPEPPGPFARPPCCWYAIPDRGAGSQTVEASVFLALPHHSTVEQLQL